MSGNNIEGQYPFSGTQSRFIFFTLVIASVIIALDICCNTKLLPQVKSLFNLQIFILAISSCLISFSLSENSADFIKKLFLVLLLFAPIVAHISFYPSTLLYIFSFITILVWAQQSTIKTNRNSPIESFLISCYVVLVVVSVVVSAGEWGYLPYYVAVSDTTELNRFETLRSIVKNENLQNLLDIRYIISLIFILSLSAVALTEACRVPALKIKRIPSFSPSSNIDNSKSFIFSILHPFILVASVFLNFINMICDSIYKMVYTILFYLYQFSSKICHKLWSYFSNKSIWRSLVKVFASYSIVTILAYQTIDISSIIGQYLSSGSSITGEGTKEASRVFLFFMGTLFSLSFFRALWFGVTEWRKSLERSAMAGAVLILAFTLSGYIIHIIKYTKLLHITGFVSIGPFLIVMTSIMAVFMIYAFSKAMIESKSKATKEQ